MRLLLWVLLVALATFLTSAGALSTINPDKKLVLQVNSGEKTALLTTDDENNRTKRLLRGKTKEIDAARVEDDEERAIMIKLEGLFQRLKERVRAINPFSTENMEKRFAVLANEGKTPDYFKKEYRIGTWSSRHWNRRFYREYRAWYQRTHPDWVSSLS
ncbi:putative secreted RxLR effector protein [Phytophthora cinnamomi]|uniref:putative secreted RxLR effector protein n=1 Tax=Phytophthora cinnamomi TaxID=4785 RepID=UPI002B31C536|nr:putative secreted RxLR effector protein [Phytophthora cinnamomi]QVE55546.1 RxLR effector protein 35 [Phytophthora cinnamomi]